MAQKLKLNIYRISLKKRGAKNTDLKNFEEFFNLFEGEEKEDKYERFIGSFKDSFNNQFQTNVDETKGISATKENKFTISTTKNVINGEVIGGNLGSEQIIYDQMDSTSKRGKITSKQIASLPFYIKLWTPFDYSSGVLMIQSYSTYGVTQLIQDKIRANFIEKDYDIIITPFIPKSLKEAFLQRSDVYKLQLVKDKVSKDKRSLINPIFTEFENLKVTISITGFKKNVNDFWEMFKTQKKKKEFDTFIRANLSDLGIESPEDYNLKAFYVDHNGLKAHVGIERPEELKPTFFLPESLQNSLTSHYIFNKIEEFTNGVLEEIKTEINYSNK